MTKETNRIKGKRSLGFFVPEIALAIPLFLLLTFLSDRPIILTDIASFCLVLSLIWFLFIAYHSRKTSIASLEWSIEEISCFSNRGQKLLSVPTSAIEKIYRAPGLLKTRYTIVYKDGAGWESGDENDALYDISLFSGRWNLNSEIPFVFQESDLQKLYATLRPSKK